LEEEIRLSGTIGVRVGVGVEGTGITEALMDFFYTWLILSLNKKGIMKKTGQPKRLHRVSL
jgi:hypothetical protein